MQSQLVRQYIRLLTNVSGMKVADMPALILPATKPEIAAALDEERVTAALDPKSQGDLSTIIEATAHLDNFEDDPRRESGFLASVITKPFLLALIYALWIGFSRGEWIWILIPFIIGVSASVCLFTKAYGSHRKLWYSFIAYPLGLVFLISYAVLWCRLVFVSGLYGIYTGFNEGLNIWNLILAIIALIFGWHFSKQINRLHYFVFDNKFGGSQMEAEAT